MTTLSHTKPLLDLQFHDPVFSVAAHPSQPVLAIGLASGHIYLLKYDIKGLHSISDKSWKVKITKDGYEGSAVEIMWKTKRHKGSVRSMAFDATGEVLFSIGSDKIVKKSASMNGKVIKKTCLEEGQKSDFTKILKSQTHDILILGDESGSLLILDSNTLEIKNTLKQAHEDAINDIVQQMPNKYPHRFIAVGSTTLSIFDARKEKPTVVSDDQEDEILSATLVNPEDNDSWVLCGMSDGIITIWNSKNGFRDQLNRIKLAKDESIDCIISSFKDDGLIWAGCSNGLVYKIDAKKGKVLENRIHSKSDEVCFLDIDYGFRVISGGMDNIRLWADDETCDDDDDDDLDVEEEEGSESNDDDEFKGFQDDSDWEDIEQAIQEKESIERKEQVTKEKKRKTEENTEEEEKNPKLTKKQRQKLEKRLKNLEKHEHGIKRFDDL